VACFGFEIALEQVPVPRPRAMGPIPRFPAIVRDVSFFVPEDIPAAEMRDRIEAAQEPQFDTPCFAPFH
jgi:phenylalanyl-tRNA synthetase beta subunit